MENKFEIITGEGRPIRSMELATFLERLSKVNYLAHIFLRRGHIPSSSNINLYSLVREFEGFLYQMDPMDLSGELLFLHRSNIPDIEFHAITTNSPIKFIGYCTGVSIIALSLSIALAGGEADLKNQTFKVHSLADAAVRLYRAIDR